MSTFGELVRNVRGRDSRKAFAFKIGYSERNLEEVENDRSPGSPDFAKAVTRVTGCREVTKHYCRKQCPIGQEEGLEILNNIDLHPMAVLAKLRQELTEALGAVEKLMPVCVNKKSQEDFSQAEMMGLSIGLHEIIDVIHNGKIFVFNVASQWTNITEELRLHNTKCYEKGYVVTKEKQTHRRQAIESVSCSRY